MTILIVGSFLFLATHLGVSSTPLRAALVSTIGQGAYLGLYSLMAALTLGVMIYGYLHASHTEFLWMPGLAGHFVVKALMPFSFVFIVSGLVSKNPTNVGGDSAVNEELAGIFKVVRHPVQWGILLWAIGHMVANADVASIIFFGSFALLSSLGMVAMDAKRRGNTEPGWQKFYATTSYFPFAALISGRTSLKFNELNKIGVGVGLAVFVLVYVFHGWIAGVALM